MGDVHPISGYTSDNFKVVYSIAMFKSWSNEAFIILIVCYLQVKTLQIPDGKYKLRLHYVGKDYRSHKVSFNGNSVHSKVCSDEA